MEKSKRKKWIAYSIGVVVALMVGINIISYHETGHFDVVQTVIIFGSGVLLFTGVLSVVFSSSSTQKTEQIVEVVNKVVEDVEFLKTNDKTEMVYCSGNGNKK